MKNILDVIKQKEAELERLQRDIETLRAAHRLLSDDADSEATSVRPMAATGNSPKTATLRQFP